jgi:hypothetical protein
VALPTLPIVLPVRSAMLPVVPSVMLPMLAVMAMPLVIVPSVAMVPLAGVMTVAPLPISVGAVIRYCGERQRKHCGHKGRCKQPKSTVRLKLRVHAGGVARLKNP